MPLVSVPVHAPVHASVQTRFRAPLDPAPRSALRRLIDRLVDLASAWVEPRTDRDPDPVVRSTAPTRPHAPLARPLSGVPPAPRARLGGPDRYVGFDVPTYQRRRRRIIGLPDPA